MTISSGGEIAHGAGPHVSAPPASRQQLNACDMGRVPVMSYRGTGRWAVVNACNGVQSQRLILRTLPSSRSIVTVLQ